MSEAIEVVHVGIEGQPPTKRDGVYLSRDEYEAFKEIKILAEAMYKILSQRDTKAIRVCNAFRDLAARGEGG